MSEKTEGTFKIKSRPKLTEQQLAAKNKEPLIDVPSNVTKVVIPKEDITVVDPLLEGAGEGDGVIKEIVDDKSIEPAKPAEAPAVPVAPAVELPENVTKLVDFMRETGGTMQDYMRLNTNYDDVDRDVLVKEYYKNTKSHLSAEEIEFMIEDNFAFDEELTEDQAKASDFFNRYKEDQERNVANHDKFKAKTNELLNENFEGFDFSLGEKKFRYGIQNPSQIAEKQSDISNFIGKFLGEDGTITDTAGYHKALYAGANADKMANHFYEQGKADATRDILSKSKNPSTGARQAAPVEGIKFGAYKVKSVSGADSSKLKIKKFKN